MQCHGIQVQRTGSKVDDAPNHYLNASQKAWEEMSHAATHLAADVSNKSLLQGIVDCATLDSCNQVITACYLAASLQSKYVYIGGKSNLNCPLCGDSNKTSTAILIDGITMIHEIINHTAFRR